jgi:AcrR family transcriptional regulator
MKEQGLDLKEIGERLADRVEAASENTVDLVARQNEQTHSAILETAARRFAERGYDKTRISDICKEVGVTPQVLYGHFPSKRHLFIACFRVYFDWMHAQVSKPIEEADDSAARVVWRSWAGYGIQTLSPDLQALARVEALHPESELQPLVRETYKGMLEDSERELAAERKPGANPGLFDDVLVVHALLGALENMQMRASWDDRFSIEDVMRNHVAIFAAIRAAYAGRVDLTDDWTAVAPLVKKLAAELPPEQGSRGGLKEKV